MYSLYIQLFILYVYLLCISIVINRVMIGSVLLNGWCYKVHILLCLQCTCNYLVALDNYYLHVYLCDIFLVFVNRLGNLLL